MTISQSCPTDATLLQYLTGKLSDEQLDAVGEHLERCTGCLERLEILEQQPLETLLHDLKGLPSAGDSLIFQHQDMQPRSDFSDMTRSDKQELPERIGQYTILGVLGHGGMGIVYEAEQPHLNRRVAIKVIHARHRLGPDMLTRFQRELETLSRLEHTNIVRAYDAGIHRGEPFLVMELLRGIDLGQFVLKRPLLDFVDAVKLIRQSVAGLHFAHKLGFIHRDIKPSNLFLTNSGVVKLLDFGLAKTFAAMNPEDNADSFGQTQTGMIVGSCDFIAPEQIKQSGKVDHRADIYALGCTLYFLLTKRAPYTGSQLAVLASHLRDPFPLVRALRPELPDSLDQLLQRMTAKNPEDRLRSVDQVAATLQHIRRHIKLTAQVAPPPVVPASTAPADASATASPTVSMQNPFEVTDIRPFPELKIDNVKKPTAAARIKRFSIPFPITMLLVGLIVLTLAYRYYARSQQHVEPVSSNKTVVTRQETIPRVPQVRQPPLVEPEPVEELPIEPVAELDESVDEVEDGAEPDEMPEDAPLPEPPKIIEQMDKPVQAEPVRKTPKAGTKAAPQVVDPVDDPRNIPDNKLFWNREMSGWCSFDYESNNGVCAIGEGIYMFETNWSACGRNSMHIYNDAKSVDAVALALWAKSPREIRHASELDFSSRTRAPNIGELIVLRNQHGKYAVLKITKVVNRDRVRADHSLLEFDYAILPDGDDFNNLP